MTILLQVPVVTPQAEEIVEHRAMAAKRIYYTATSAAEQVIPAIYEEEDKFHELWAKIILIIIRT